MKLIFNPFSELGVETLHALLTGIAESMVAMPDQWKSSNGSILLVTCFKQDLLTYEDAVIKVFISLNFGKTGPLPEGVEVCEPDYGHVREVIDRAVANLK